MLAILADPPSIQIRPSGPAVMPREPFMQPKVLGGDGSAPHGYSVFTPLTVIAPILLNSLNHSRLSGPTVISPGVLLVENSVTAPAVVILATTLAFPSKLPSVNQRLP